MDDWEVISGVLSFVLVVIAVVGVVASLVVIVTFPAVEEPSTYEIVTSIAAPIVTTMLFVGAAVLRYFSKEG